jgi:hypothetical protein
MPTPSEFRPDAAARLATLDLAPTPEELAAAQTKIPPHRPKPAKGKPPRETAVATLQSLHDIRTAFVGQCYALLRDKNVWARLQDHLEASDPKVSLKAFEILIGGIVSATKAEAESRGPVLVKIENHIAGPGGLAEPIEVR